MIERTSKTIKTHSHPPSPSRNSAARWVAAIFRYFSFTGHPAATPQCVTVGIDTDCQGTNFILRLRTGERLIQITSAPTG